MTNLGAAWRAAAMAGAVMLAAGAAQPAAAASSDVALLQTYMGDYRGTGTVSGQDNETINCRMSISSGNAGKINYQGRCLLAGANLGIAGTIAYNEARHQFEAAMTSSTAFAGEAIGRRVGESIVFKLDKRAVEKGSDLTIAVGIVLHNGVVDVDFKVQDAATGGVTKAVIPFKRGTGA